MSSPSAVAAGAAVWAALGPLYSSRVATRASCRPRPHGRARSPSDERGSIGPSLPRDDPDHTEGVMKGQGLLFTVVTTRVLPGNARGREETHATSWRAG